METPNSRSTNRRRWARYLGVGSGALAAVATVAVAAPAGAATPSNAPIGATGSVAALSGSSMEVQNPASGQTTVNWTTTTQFSKVVTESVSSLAAGDCISATGTASKKSKTTIAARTITVTTPNASGACTGNGARFGIGPGGTSGGFRFGGGAPSRVGGGFEGAPSGGTTRTFPGAGAGGGRFRQLLGSLTVASGKVTAVSGSTVTLTGIELSPGSFPRRSSEKAQNATTSQKTPATPKTETLKITTSSSTTLSATQSAAAGDLAVGDCVSAFGPAAANGAVTASTVRITTSSGGTCTGGGAFFGGGGGFPGGAGGPDGPGGPGGAGGSGA